ncbi:MAG: dipeptidyl peptidase 3 [Rikenellaceae bacterium]|nr:dipeptidyl peptidase 3 [Rikenellaceae bacterium]
MRKIILIMITTGILSGCASGSKENPKDDFTWQVDRFDDVKVLKYQVPGFETLNPDQKILIYYLSQAALCGRDILYDQNFKYNLPIRRTLEAVYINYEGDRAAEEFKALEKYLKKIWFANGIHHHYSMDKFIPEFSEQYFDNVVNSIPEDKLPLDFGKKDHLLAVIKPAMFDPELYKKRVCLDSDKDMIVNSAMNYYEEGITQTEVEEFYGKMVTDDDLTPVSYGLNSKLVKDNGQLVERKWKLCGMYSQTIDKILFWLNKALPYAENEVQKKTIQQLISYYKSGDLKTFDEYSVTWVKDTVSEVDFVNGFIEVYGDPLGYKASWEAIVNFKNIEATKRTETISEWAQWFEDNSPIDNKFKKKEVKGVSAKVITVATLGGDYFPPTPIGINLPNSDWIRRDHGSKSVTIENITHAYSQASKGDGFADEFVLREDDKERMEKYGSLADNLHTDLHECLGHGSGVLAPGVKGDELKNYGSTLEEARADLFALYYLADPKMVEIGLIPNLDVAKAEYAKYMMNGLMTQLTRIQPGKNVEESHMRNRKLIAEWCYEKGLADNVIEKIVENGKTYIVVNDFDKLRGLFADLLREVQRIKSEGDFDAGKKLVESYGVKVDPELHNEVMERYAKLDLAPYSGFINPILHPVQGDDGKIIDVVIEYQNSFTEQMLHYSENFSYLPSKN